MADTLTISIVDQSVAAENPVNIAVINQPNPVSGFTASAEQILDLLAFPKYFITDDGTGKPVNGDNFYEYFPDLDPHSGGGGGGGATILSGDTDPSSGDGDNGDIYLKTTNTKLEGIAFGHPRVCQVDYLMNADSVVEFDCMLPAPVNTYDTPWGSRGTMDHFIAYDGGTLRYVYDGVSGNIGSISAYYNKRMLITVSRTNVKVECDGSTVYDVAINGGSTTSDVYLGFCTLFTSNIGAYNNMCCTDLTFYGCKISENGTVVRNYVPHKDSHNVLCIMDTISGMVFYPSASGTATGEYITTPDDFITDSFLKVNDDWQSLIGSNIDDVNTSGGGGGGTGTDDYDKLSNKPSINSVTLSGNKTDVDLGIQNCIYDDQTDELYTMVDGSRVVLVTNVKAEPLIPAMTSVNTPEGLVESGNNYGYGSYGNQNIWNAFDRDVTTYVTYQQENVTNGFISYEFATGNVRYVTKITALFGNHKATNSIPATLYVYDENDVETEVSTVTVAGYAATTYGTFTFDVHQNVKKLKFVFGSKTNNTNIYTYDIQAYGWVVS